MFKKLWNSLQEFALKDIISYIKAKFGEAEALADKGSFGSWAAYVLAIIKDLIGLINAEPAPATKAGKAKKQAPATAFVRALIAKKEVKDA